MTRFELLKAGRARLAAAGIDGVDAELLLRRALNESRETFLTRLGEAADAPGYEALLAKRLGGEPTAYILGGKAFMGLDFYVDGRVLIPRADTERLVELALKEAAGKTGLELGTGSGCIAVSLAVLGHCRMFAVDISRDALNVARHNAERHKAGVAFAQSDLFDNLPVEMTGGFDFIVSNPPYIETAELSALTDLAPEPALALDGGADGLDFYRRIAAEAAGWLADGGRLFLETGRTQAAQAAVLLEQNGFRGIGAEQDYAGRDRVVTARVDKHV